MGIPVGYADVGRDDDLPGSPIYVLESPEFTLDQAAKMHFDYYVRSASALMEVSEPHQYVYKLGRHVWTTSTTVRGRYHR